MQPKSFKNTTHAYNMITYGKPEMHMCILACICRIILPVVTYVTPNMSTLRGFCFSLWCFALLFSVYFV